MHIPVLLNDFLRLAEPKSGEVWVDCTLGGGGYTQALAEKVGEHGRVIALDWDEKNVSAFAGPTQVTTVVANFGDIKKVLRQLDLTAVDGIVADLGFSSDQLSGRGLSFSQDEPLDMRLFSVADNAANSAAPSAQDLLEKSSHGELVRIFREFGEEPRAERLADLIVGRRQHQPIATTGDLKALVAEAYQLAPEKIPPKLLARPFMALRIAVNSELANLSALLNSAPDLLKPNGRLAVVTFHSLEDRPVKKFFRRLCANCSCPEDAPVCTCPRKSAFRDLTRKAVKPSVSEIEQNPRSRSARLRIIQKI